MAVVEQALHIPRPRRRIRPKSPPPPPPTVDARPGFTVAREAINVRAGDWLRFSWEIDHACWQLKFDRDRVACER